MALRGIEPLHIRCKRISLPLAYRATEKRKYIILYSFASIFRFGKNLNTEDTNKLYRFSLWYLLVYTENQS